MKLSNFFPAKNIIWELSSTQKAEAIRELVLHLVSTKSIPKDEATSIERAMMRREELGSTGIGKGMGVPHAKHAGVQGIVGAFGRSSKGIEFNALDGQPVHLVFLLLSSPDAIEPHLQALRKITALLKDDDVCAFLRRAKNKTELAEILSEMDDRLGGAPST